MPTTFVALFTFQTAHLVPAARFASGGLQLCFANPNRGVGGAPRNVRVRAKHPLGLHMTRQARRLRGALRPMTQQYTSRNNVTISMQGGRSVPIVSQTEIDPMKTALSLILALATTTAFTEPPPVPKPPGPGGSCSHGYIRLARTARRWVLRTPSRSRATALARGNGLRRAPTACEMDARGSSLRASLRFLCRGPSPCRAGHRRVICA